MYVITIYYFILFKVDGSEYIRNKEKVETRTGHMKLKKMMKETKKRNSEASKKAKMIELLQNAQPGEVKIQNKTFEQRDILKNADVQTLQKKFELGLEMGRNSCLIYMYMFLISMLQVLMLISSIEVVDIFYLLESWATSQ